MYKFAVIGAMSGELEATIQKMSAVKNENGDYLAPDQRLVIACCGVGKVNAAATTQRVIMQYAPEYIIDAGISGGLNPALGICSTIICKSVAYHDFSPEWLLTKYPPFRTVFFSDEKLLAAAQDACRACTTAKYSIGHAVCGDRIVSDSGLANHLHKDLGADCVDMESAAIAHTCLLNNTPFLVLRVVSDFANEDALPQMQRQEFIASGIISDILWELVKRPL